MSQRLPVLWAKATLYAGVTFSLMLAAAFTALLGGQQFLGPHGTNLSATYTGTGSLSASTSLLVLLGWVAGALIAAAFLLKRRDA